MSFIGLITAYNEAGNIGPAVASLFEIGCDHVVAVDGAWANLDGTPFGGGSWSSSDGTMGEAIRARAFPLSSPPQHGGDGAKRDWALHRCGATPGDHIFCLDADERAVGTLEGAPSGHGCVVLHNRGNELPFRTPMLDYESRASVPLLRWLRYDPTLRCEAPGRYTYRGKQIEPYLVRELEQELTTLAPRAVQLAHRALRDHEHLLGNEYLTVLPILPHVEIHHVGEPSAERVAAKLRYYEGGAG